LHDIEVKIKTNETLNRMYGLTLIEIEQFKIQLEILEQKFNKEKILFRLSGIFSVFKYNSFYVIISKSQRGVINNLCGKK